MPNKLYKLKIDRVDLVPRGANQEAHVTFAKRDESAPTASDAYQEIQLRASELLGAGWCETMADAVSTVCKRHPQLYAAYTKAASVQTKVKIKE
jgi:hypothetical protein